MAIKQSISWKLSSSPNRLDNSGVFVTSIGNTSLITRLTHPLKYKILLDNCADGHVCNHLALAASSLKTPNTPTFVQAAAHFQSLDMEIWSS